MVVPITIAWFIGALWWFGQHPAIVRAANGMAREHTAIAPHGPERTSHPVSIAPIATSAGPNTSHAIEEGRTTMDPLLFEPFIVPFVKNEEGTHTNDALQHYIVVLLSRLRSHPAMSITITGHSDADGDAELNLRLSKERADQLRAILIAKGIPSELIRTVGRGAERPIADNLTSKGKAQNRRVEITIDEHPPSTPPEP